MPLWEKGCCLLSVQVAEKHEWCVWQWCVCWRIYMGMHGLGDITQSASHWTFNSVSKEVSAQLCTDLCPTGTNKAEGLVKSQWLDGLRGP